MVFHSRWRPRMIASTTALSLSAAFMMVGFGATPAQADDENEHGMGAIPSTERILPSKTDLKASTPKAVNLKKWTVPVANQGKVNSCVAWVVAYNMMGWYGNRTGGPVNSFAPMYMYSQINGGKDRGARIPDAFKIAVSQGNDTMVHYSHSDTNWKAKPVAAEKAVASQFKLTGYKALFINNAGAGANGQAVIKKYLAAGRPVAIGLPIRKGLDNLSPTNTIDRDTTSPSRGGHSLLAVGYNSSGLLVQNQWGTRWGAKGFGWLAWNVVQKDVKEAYVATGYKVTHKPIAGSVSDMNGDQLADIIATKSDGSSMLYLNTGNRKPYASASKIGSGWQNFNRISFADTNGDGKSDILATKRDGTLWLYRNTGKTSPRFYHGVMIGKGWQGSNRLIVADVNGDGRADILRIKADGTLWLYRNTGKTSPCFYRGIKIGGPSWRVFNKVIAADVNGDRKADILATKPDGTLMYYRNTGKTTRYFSPGVRAGSGWTVFNKIAAADVNGDRRADVLARRTDGTLWLYRSTGKSAPYFLPGIKIGSGWQVFSYIG